MSGGTFVWRWGLSMRVEGQPRKGGRSEHEWALCMIATGSSDALGRWKGAEDVLLAAATPARTTPAVHISMRRERTAVTYSQCYMSSELLEQQLRAKGSSPQAAL